MLAETFITKLNELISSTKNLYYENLGKKLNNPLIQAKTYWSILKTFYNEKKILVVPPLLVRDTFLTYIKAKTSIFNNVFAEQCTPLKNYSILPTNHIFWTESRLCSLDFNEDEILKIIMESNNHSDIWKRFNIIPVNKKSDKKLVKNYRPISLLPIFGKIFEKIIFNRLYSFLLDETLFNPNQSGFRPADSSVNQLLAITHDIFEAFGCNRSLQVRSVISTVFDKV